MHAKTGPGSWGRGTTLEHGNWRCNVVTVKLLDSGLRNREGVFPWQVAQHLPVPCVGLSVWAVNQYCEKTERKSTPQPESHIPHRFQCLNISICVLMHRWIWQALWKCTWTCLIWRSWPVSKLPFKLYQLISWGCVSRFGWTVPYERLIKTHFGWCLSHWNITWPTNAAVVVFKFLVKDKKMKVKTNWKRETGENHFNSILYLIRYIQNITLSTWNNIKLLLKCITQFVSHTYKVSHFRPTTIQGLSSHVLPVAIISDSLLLICHQLSLNLKTDPSPKLSIEQNDTGEE